jgi:RNA polymerase sigma-70 factor (ECF subfamily)
MAVRRPSFLSRFVQGGHLDRAPSTRASMSPSASSPKLRLVRPSVPDPQERRDLTLEALYEDYASYVGAVASRLLGRAGEVEDVVQDVFASAVRGLRRREDDREIKGWLAKVTVRRCLRQLRTRRLWGLLDSGPAPSYENLAEPSAGPEERQLVSEVYAAMDHLSARERVAWTLRHVEGETLEDVAALCECSLATAKRRIASAHEKLTKRLEGGRTR